MQNIYGSNNKNIKEKLLISQKSEWFAKRNKDYENIIENGKTVDPLFNEDTRCVYVASKLSGYKSVWKTIPCNTPLRIPLIICQVNTSSSIVYNIIYG